MRCRCAPSILLWAVLVVSGCQPFQTRSAQIEAPRDSEALQELIARLDADAWQPNAGWSPLAEARSRQDGIPLPEQLRWAHRGWRAAQGQRAVDHKTQSENSSAPDAGAPPDGPPAADDAAPAETAAAPEPQQEFLAEVESFGPRELALLAVEDDLVGWNASILWAQADPAAAAATAPLLARLVAEPPSYVPNMEPAENQRARPPAEPAPRVISAAMQAAAVEALCLVLAQSPDEPTAAFAPALDLMARPKLSDALRAELFRGLARRLPPREIPHLKQALQYKSVNQKIEKAPTPLRRAAIEACLVYAACQPAAAAAERPASSELETAPAEASPWPDTLWNLQWDADPRIRQTFGELMAVTGHPKALEVLREQILDQDLLVSHAALRSLGRLHSPAARAELQKHAHSRAETVRVHAVAGLAAWGEAELAPFVEDESPFVRCEVARQLGQYQSTASATALRALMIDPNPQVQAAVLAGSEHWPTELAVPLLLTALGEGSLKSRQLALLQLEQRGGGPISFPLGGNRSERLEAAARAAERWRIPSETWSRLNEATPRPAARINELRLSEIQSHLEIAADNSRPALENAAALDWLRHLTAADVPLLEQLLATAGPSAAEVLYREVLPRLVAHYQALLELESRDLQVRRRAAQSLANEGAAASLPEPVVRRLREKLRYEQDRLVWRYAMTAVLKEDSPESGELALLAVNHTWPDIRVLGCEYIAYHGKHAAAGWLLPLFADPNPLVQLAAVKAAGKCHNPVVLDGPPAAGGGKGLRPWLTSPQPQLRLAVATCMSQFGDGQAMHELVRFSLDENWALRQEAVRAMGDSGQTRFVEQLLRVAWTESNPAVKHAVVGSLNRLVAPDDRPDGLAAAPNDNRLVELWANWWEERKRAQAISPAAEAAPADAAAATLPGKPSNAPQDVSFNR